MNQRITLTSSSIQIIIIILLGFMIYLPNNQELSNATGHSLDLFVNDIETKEHSGYITNENNESIPYDIAVITGFTLYIANLGSTAHSIEQISLSIHFLDDQIVSQFQWWENYTSEIGLPILLKSNQYWYYHFSTNSGHYSEIRLNDCGKWYEYSVGLLYQTEWPEGWTNVKHHLITRQVGTFLSFSLLFIFLSLGILSLLSKKKKKLSSRYNEKIIY